MTRTLAGLIDRLQETAAPDRELDFRIALEVEGILNAAGKKVLRRGLAGQQVLGLDMVALADAVPPLTESLDAARRLVPAGWRLSLVEYDAGRWEAGLHRPVLRSAAGLVTSLEVRAEADHPALALCLAALRALLA